jgi:cell wall-associated NlpC family hydrolase
LIGSALFKPSSRTTRMAGAALAVVATTVTLGVAGTPATAKPAEPTVASVTKQLDQLGKVTERLAEQYNKARLELSGAQRAAARAEGATRQLTVRYRQAQVAFAGQMQADYQSSSLGSAGALLASDSGADYLARLSTVDLLEQQNVQALQRMRTARKASVRAGAQAHDALESARTARRTVADKRAAATERTKKLNTLLSTLTAREQARYAARDSVAPAEVATTVHTAKASNPNAQKAVDFALAQIGKPYAFGASGPGSYDCSGLTAAAWEKGGVSLPHLAADQINYGARVDAGDLQPGDLVFFYSPIGHVSMYVGKGMLVSAPQTGENVKLVSFAHARSDFVGASRPGV